MAKPEELDSPQDHAISQAPSAASDLDMAVSRAFQKTAWRKRG